MLKIENVLNTSFDQLVDNIFEKSPKNKPDNASQILNNLGDYIEIYKEKKKLEVRKTRLDALLYVKDAVIDDLQEKISEQTKKGKKLIKEKENAVKENKTKILELAKTSHEFRTPVSGILGTTKLLLDTELTREQKQLIRIIETSSNSLLALINDILDYAKIKTGDLTIERVPLNLKKINKEVIEVLDYLAKERNSYLHYRVFGGIPELVDGDALRVKQVLLNLVGNAVKFTENGEVIIRTSLVKQNGRRITVRFEVTDTGIGIPDDKISDLFKTFSQVSSSVIDKSSGTGLGLAISKELVEKMGGQIGVNSKLGQGSTFWVTIPFFKHENNDDIQNLSSEKLNPKNNIDPQGCFNNLVNSDVRILLVEDDEVNQKVNSLILQKCGYQVEIADNGKSALSRLKSQNFDLVLMDIHMPEMDGLKATKTIRRLSHESLNPDIPVIAMTANTLDKDREKCLEAGMDDYIAKPIDLQELNTKIGILVSKSPFKLDNNDPAERKFVPGSIQIADLKQLHFDTNEDFIPLVELFLDHLPKRTDNIRKAVESGDYPRLKSAAHQLRGSASSFYAETLVHICSQLEELDQTDFVKQAKPIISELDREEKSVMNTLNWAIDQIDKQPVNLN